jgi:hypothetical protein
MPRRSSPGCRRRSRTRRRRRRCWRVDSYSSACRRRLPGCQCRTAAAGYTPAPCSRARPDLGPDTAPPTSIPTGSLRWGRRCTVAARPRTTASRTAGRPCTRRLRKRHRRCRCGCRTAIRRRHRAARRSRALRAVGHVAGSLFSVYLRHRCHAASLEQPDVMRRRRHVRPEQQTARQRGGTVSRTPALRTASCASRP